MTHGGVDPCVIIPVRSLPDGKRRLSGCLNAVQRHRLGRQFLLHMLAITRHWPGSGRTCVVSACPEALQLARRRGALWLRQPLHEEAASDDREAGLNAAVAYAVAQLRRHGPRDVMIVSSDLPMATTADLVELCDLSWHGPQAPRVVVAANSTGTGTNALYLPGHATLAFAYGADSCRRHAASACRQGLPVHTAHIVNLARDIDTQHDYMEWRATLRRARASLCFKRLTHGYLALR
ncbi:MAG TPA: 2-phospho-L-lactate guanylyltransferase [Bordetella sp.]|nr:2-phospho-L-lactate guanylyltransferase [Bordetella sp.]